MAVLLFLIYSAVMFGAGYYYHSHSGYASPQERLASRISMLGKL